MEYRDLQAGAMAVDSTGTYVLLAGRRYIAIKNLDDIESETLRKFPRQSKYEVGVAEWNPLPHNKQLCAISSNQRIEVLNWHGGQLSQTQSLKSHTRVVTDLNWHHFDANILASCSVDTFIHIWDIRDARRPVLSLSAVAEASQVRWNPLNTSMLATAHDGDVKLWDQRKGTAPVQYIAAHLAKIHGLQWSPHSENQLATSSQDGTVKFFDIMNPRRAEFILSTASPVWRAKFTPFGQGLVTVVVPQLRRGENSLLLWNLTNRNTPVHTFVGHSDVVLEFEWRPQQTDTSDYQLVTWSKDQTLRVWRIDPYLQKLCGHEPEKQIEDVIMDFEDGKEIKAQPVLTLPKTLQQEFSLVNMNIPNTEITDMDVHSRSCTITASANGCLVIMQIIFPPAYPINAAPSFQFSQGTTVDDVITSELLKVLNQTAQQRVTKNRTCLEPCLRRLVATLEHISANFENDKQLNFKMQHPYFEPVYGSFNDAYIPFPRTSGAKFCSVNTLVCFGRPPNARRLSMKMESSTPRALSALATNFASGRTVNADNISISSFYFQDRKHRSRHRHSKPQSARPVVIVYNASGLFFLNRILGERYKVDGDPGAVCRYNSTVAQAVGRWDLVQSWKIAELVAKSQTIIAEDDLPWSLYPFGRQLVQSLISHYADKSDIQMAAMLCCIFGKNSTGVSSGRKNIDKSNAGGSPYHTIPPADVACAADSWNFNSLRQHRSGSLDNIRLEEIISNSNSDISQHNLQGSMDDNYKLAYAEVLDRWNLLYARAEILKYMSTEQDPHKGVEFLTDCQHCDRPVRGAHCSYCKLLSLRCVLCHVSVRGSANFCLVCGHGGHTRHLQEWFTENEVCPTGCGCHCLAETAALLKPQ
ncbi:WD repeat domain 59 [Carabus blaptoides fortunei]